MSDELENRVDPISLQGGRAAYSSSSGVSSVCSILGLGAAFDYMSTIGAGRIETHNLALRNRLFAALQEVPRLSVVSAPPGPLASPLLTYTFPDVIESDMFRKRMSEKYKIELKTVPKDWLNGHRVSTHLFNTEWDVNRLVEALKIELT